MFVFLDSAPIWEPLADKLFPPWSPDGSQIAFQSLGGPNQSWVVKVIGSNGSSERQIGPRDGHCGLPSWSLSGQEILFASNIDAGEEQDFLNYEIYSMDTNGRNVVRLTDNRFWDSAPVPVPRKQGVEVSEDSVHIPGASTLKDKDLHELTAGVKDAVVRIETDLGTKGTGFIVESEGVVLTNNHVIKDARTITVFLEDGTRYDGKLLGRDLIRDLALVKIEASELSALELGDVIRSAVGSDVLVIGYPLGVTGLTTTQGEVSSIKYDDGRNVTYVQTDSTINPGNSGGPLLNMQGQVIGMVTSKITGDEIEDIGLAVSSNTIMLYLGRLQSGEEITN